MKRFIATTVIAIISAFISIQNYGKKNDNAIDTSTTNTQRSEVSRRNLAAGIHEMMGGELALRVDNSGTEEFFSSNPFMPREYVGTGTAFIHFKNATEQDAEGETTFPPSKSPMAQYSGWFTPTEYPSRVPTKYPATLKVDDTHHPSEKLTPDPSRKSTQNPNSFSANVPSLKPSKMPTKGPTKRPSRKPTGGPTKEPTRGVSSFLVCKSCPTSFFLKTSFFLLSPASYLLVSRLENLQEGQLGNPLRNQQDIRLENQGKITKLRVLNF